MSTCLAQDAANPPVALPLAPHAVAGKGDHRTPRLTVTLNRHGEVYINLREFSFGEFEGVPAGPKLVSLDELYRCLTAATRVYDMIQRRKGRSGYEKFVSGSVTRLGVRLRVDKDAPWAHVEWIHTILAERHIWNVQLAVKARADRGYPREEAQRLGAVWKDIPPDASSATLPANLPNDAAVDLSKLPPKKPQKIVTLVVKIAEDETEMRAWGRARGERVPMPTRVHYEFANQKTPLSNIEKRIREASAVARGQKAEIATRVMAELKVPFKHVVAVLDRFRAAGHGDIWWAGTAFPTPAVRVMKPLPYPDPSKPETQARTADAGPR
jgi:biopolymer transport protein ExbD